MKNQGTILISDVNKGLQAALVLLAEKEFTNVIAETRYDKIIQLAKSESIDIIILDIVHNSPQQQEEYLNFIKEITSLDLHIQIITLINFSQNNFGLETVNSGAFDFIPKPWNNEKLQVTLRNAYRMRQYMISLKQIDALKESFRSENPFFWGISDATKGIFEASQKFAQTETPVFLCGEKGSGKELLAQQIHNLSRRNQNMFIKADAGTLVEGELERKLEISNGGTIYIENIELLDNDKQKLLLNVLNNKNISNLGYSKSISTNIRLIAGSYSNFNTLTTENQITKEFAQLFKKSNLRVPSLNERGEDIIPLATIFLNKYCRKYSKNITGFSELAKEILITTKWVGNTSELSLTIERAVILTPDGGTIQPGYIMLNTHSDDTSKESISTLTIEQMEKKMMRAALKRNNGNITLAAEQLGITRQTLYNKGKKYKLFK